MKISRTKARSRLAAKLPKGSPSIRYMKHVGVGLMAFRQDKKTLLTTTDDAIPTIIGECEAEGLNEIPPAMTAWLEETAREVGRLPSQAETKRHRQGKGCGWRSRAYSELYS